MNHSPTDNGSLFLFFFKQEMYFNSFQSNHMSIVVIEAVEIHAPKFLVKLLEYNCKKERKIREKKT